MLRTILKLEPGDLLSLYIGKEAVATDDPENCFNIGYFFVDVVVDYDRASDK